MKISQDALVLIDIQEGFNEPVWGKRNDGDFSKNISRLLESWRSSNLPVIHVQHISEIHNSPLRAGQPGVDFMAFAKPQANELVIPKKVNSAFIGTPLEFWLRRWEIRRVILAGISTDHCVSTTARMGANLGFKMVVVSDATFAFERKLPDGKTFSSEMVHAVSLATLTNEFAEILATGEIT